MVKIVSYDSMKEWCNQKPSRNDGTSESQYSLPAPYNKSVPGILEADVKRAAENVLKLGKVFFRRIQVMAKPVHTGNDTMVFTPSSMQGMADIIACVDGQMIGIELKKPGGKVKSTQLFFLQELQKAGGRGCILVDPSQLLTWFISTNWPLKLQGIDVV